MPPTTTADFGRNFAVLNVDWMSILIEAIQDTTEGKSFIENISRWNNVVHQKEMRPLTLFSTLALKFGQPELEANTPFSDLIAPFGTFEEGSPEVQIDPQFLVDEKDVIIHKTRWSATTGNSLEQILKANKIDTVVVVSNMKKIRIKIILTSEYPVWIESLWCCYEYYLPTLRHGLQNLCHRRCCDRTTGGPNC